MNRMDVDGALSSETRRGPRSLVNLLALDTSNAVAALAVGTASGAMLGTTPDPAQRHGRNLIPAIHDLLESAGVTPRALGGIAVVLGPGSYTGLRVGVTAAKVLAYALEVPLAGLDGLDVLARNAPEDALHVAVIGDAQRGEVYAADFNRAASGGALVRTAPTRVQTQAEWVSGLMPGTFVLGPGLDRLATPLPETVLKGEPRMARPVPERLLALAREVWAAGERVDPWLLEPSYLRRSAAEEMWDRKSTS